MTELFADLPEAAEACGEIAMLCAYRPLTRKPILPRFSAARGAALDEEQELRRQASDGLSARLAAHGLAPGRTEEDYARRLAFELDVIVNMTFAGYFLIVADFIQWANAQGIPIGPVRG
jgi:DNA polymerase-3 subunit alpha